MNNLNDLEKVIGYEFNDQSLLIDALTHVSFANDNNVASYDRLEFLGDAIIEFVVSDYIFKHIILDSGASTKLRASLVSTDYLCNVSKELQLESYCRKSKSLQQLGKKNVADLFESLVGAVFVDGGLEKAKELINKFVIIDDSNVGYVIKTSIDYKSKLQEYMQANSIDFEYVLLAITGPDHKKEFEVSLDIDGISVVVEKGSSIQQAEEKCAEFYFNKINY